jgi:hypothetical protein
MKKLLMILVCVSISGTALAQFEVQDDGVVSSDAPYNTYSTFSCDIVNLTGTHMLLSWDMLLLDVVAGWDYSLCDYGACYFDPIPTSAPMDTIPSGSDGWMKLNINPGTIDGTTTVKVKVYETATPGTSDSIIWTITSKAPSGIASTTNNEITIQPNPAKDVVVLEVNQSGNMEIRDLMGKLIYRKQVQQGMTRIYTSALPRGIYLLNFSSPTTQQTHKLILH